ncbi:MAG: DNA helicase UvrD [Elusimicrobia bacterium]|nr:DNA helicase UvrD [Elusimicrobiota bacterium]
MIFTADLHIHSRFSRACSRSLAPETLHVWAQKKGVTVLSAGDFTHPAWRAELKEKLIPAEEGLFRLRPDLAREADASVPASCRADMRFLLGVEISCIYSKDKRVRRVHHLVYAPSFGAAERVVRRLEKIGNLGSDGRPILGLDSKSLLDIVLEAGGGCRLVPAHAWTPHFGVFGSQSGFDSLEECFGDLAPEIFAIETGLSSDPPMNWRLKALDRIALISNSDAHSAEKIGREANVFDSELSYEGIFGPVEKRDPGRFLGTIEFFPEEGKYHCDGHRKCGARLTPAETRRNKGRCPSCGKPVTVGVLSRVEALADRGPGRKPAGAPGFVSSVPLKEILGEILGVGALSKAVKGRYEGLLERFGSERFVLHDLDLGKLAAAGEQTLARALSRLRAGKAGVEAGYDGEYGKVRLLNGRRAAAV